MAKVLQSNAAGQDAEKGVDCIGRLQISKGNEFCSLVWRRRRTGEPPGGCWLMRRWSLRPQAVSEAERRLASNRPYEAR
jgi:hypothetical protein